LKRKLPFEVGFVPAVPTSLEGGIHTTNSGKILKIVSIEQISYPQFLLPGLPYKKGKR